MDSNHLMLLGIAHVAQMANYLSGAKFSIEQLKQYQRPEEINMMITIKSRPFEGASNT
jgi:hypothetical protein